MSDLIQALQILLKYGDPRWPTHCEHDELIVDVNPDIVSAEDKAELDKLGFFHMCGEEYFTSYRFGSC